MVFGITINIMFHGLSLCLNARAIIVTNLTKDNCNKFECSWQRCWKNAFYQPNRKTFNCYTLILFSCGLIHFWEFCVGCYACNESPKVLNLQIIIYTTRLPPMKSKPLKRGTFFAETFYSYAKWSNRSWSSSFELQYWKVVQSPKRVSSMLSVKSEKVTFQKRFLFNNLIFWGWKEADVGWNYNSIPLTH